VVSRPDLAGEFRAQLALGRAGLLAGDWPRAEIALKRAIELHPFLVSAMNDLGVARLSQQKLQEAQQSWKQALELNPQFEAARRNLEASEEIGVTSPPPATGNAP
jgi:tetratricopeptide (TPR) repeat protein